MHPHSQNKLQSHVGLASFRGACLGSPWEVGLGHRGVCLGEGAECRACWTCAHCHALPDPVLWESHSHLRREWAWRKVVDLRYQQISDHVKIRTDFLPTCQVSRYWFIE